MRITCFIILTILLSTSAPAFANLLANPGFEVRGSSDERANHWDGDEEGGAWGSTIRTDWQSLQGKYSSAVRGAWSGLDHGGLWQACPVIPGVRYKACVNFMWDNEWKATKFELRVEWFSKGEQIDVVRRQILNLPEAQWSLETITATAPPSADAAHIVIDISGVEEEGVLYMDELAFAQD